MKSKLRQNMNIGAQGGTTQQHGLQDIQGDGEKGYLF
jgi:hypothetical protein